MDVVTVKKSELELIVKKNRSLHNQIFLESVEGYKVEAERLLKQHLERVRNGKLATILINLPMPQDHTKDYDRILKQLEMSVDDEIEITDTDFAQYVMDDWSWKREFFHTALAYNSQTAVANSSAQ